MLLFVLLFIHPAVMCQELFTSIVRSADNSEFHWKFASESCSIEQSKSPAGTDLYRLVVKSKGDLILVGHAIYDEKSLCLASSKAPNPVPIDEIVIHPDPEILALFGNFWTWKSDTNWNMTLTVIFLIGMNCAMLVVLYFMFMSLRV